MTTAGTSQENHFSYYWTKLQWEFQEETTSKHTPYTDKPFSFFNPTNQLIF